ncbi:glutathione peroxidase [Peptoniphilus sp. KCTC 25270]|uniref:glutathione peroxidase n=1 Tax=Peptoniphilus sp. KCTC 25270 TaxID=2897414 RepID=UPI001E58837C|nr:glutathione peroxidase [Peptoniphilus sp. KCTC 25270]MCD1147678.1 glutathione peroxidase [Peptoniphilus sp. KCTC 25270]
MGFYDFALIDGTGKEISMENYRGKVVLVVNTATECGFTPQYEDLQKLFEKYHEKGLEIIDVPSNQFRGQAPGTDEEIAQFCSLNFHTQFSQMKKSDVNGEKELPLFTFLKKEKGFEGFGKGAKALAMSAMLKAMDKDYKNNSDIKWNFTKFLIDREGNVVERFEPTEKMEKVEEAVLALL